MGRRLRSLVAGLPWAEIGHGAAIVAGWTLLLAGLASLLGLWQVWALGGGVFLLSIAGWGHLRELFGTGLYALTRTKDGKG